jgi:nicotinamide-nucleotide amidase
VVTPDSRLHDEARKLLAALEERGLKLATAESCTGGLVAAALTAIPGCSHVLERGFVTYSNDAKQEMLGVSAATLEQFGAVSEQTARAMAEGALKHSHAAVSVSVTGVAGPDGGSEEKPVGLVHFAAQRRGGKLIHRVRRFGNPGREEVQRRAALEALDLIGEAAGVTANA